jgi:NADH:ubiquinone oxidoreductase subunit 4 (subunit M)
VVIGLLIAVLIVLGVYPEPLLRLIAAVMGGGTGV